MKKILRHKIKKLLIEIKKAFSIEPVPSKQDLISYEYEECWALRDDFTGYVWSKVPRKILEIHYDSLPLFTPLAYHYYIPSYLSYSLQRKCPTNESWVSDIPPSLMVSKYQPFVDFTLYSLDISLASNEKEYDLKRFECFNLKQLKVVRNWLCFIQNNLNEFNVQEQDVNSALKTIVNQIIKKT
jgi:hypothetical protein